MAAGSGNFSLHTEGHSHHSAVWTMAGVSMPTICLACAMDMLENRKKELTVRIMMILKELTLSTSRHEKQTQLMRMMASDWRITSHVCNVVIGKSRLCVCVYFAPCLSLPLACLCPLPVCVLCPLPAHLLV